MVFIGSHLVDELTIRVKRVCVCDNLSIGNPINLGDWFAHPRLTHKPIGLCSRISDLGDLDVVFRFAANTEARTAFSSLQSLFRQNVEATLLCRGPSEALEV
jgi:nucleoside-diphosphate-sugar epimerase